MVMEPGAWAVPREIDLKPYGTANLQATVFPTFPTGHVVPPLNTFGVPFNIPDKGKNYVTIGGYSSPTPITIRVNVPGVRKVYTLMQAFGPWEGAGLCSLEFIAGDGTRQKFGLRGGWNIRDFFESGFARSINNTTTRPAFELIGRGGAYTSNTTNGPRGYYDFDEQEYTLDDAFANQSLDSIVIDAPGAGSRGTPFLIGLTVQTAEPPPFSFFSGIYSWLLPAGVALVAAAIGVIVAIRRRVPVS